MIENSEDRAPDPARGEHQALSAFHGPQRVALA